MRPIRDPLLVLEVIRRSLRGELGLPTLGGPELVLSARQIQLFRQAGQIWLIRRSAPGISWAPQAKPLVLAALANQLRAAMSHLETMALLRETMAQADIQTLFYKGTALGLQTTGSAGARITGDIDVWVDPQHVAEADRVLQGMGWVPKPGQLPVPQGDHTVSHRLACETTYVGCTPSVDLHWRTEPTAGTLRIPFATAWQQSEVVGVADCQIRTPSRQHAALITAAHGARSFWPHWKWLVDGTRQLHQLAPAELDQLRSLARRTGAARALALLEALAADLLGEPRLRLRRDLESLVHLTWQRLLDPEAAVLPSLAERQRWRAVVPDRRRDAVHSFAAPLLRHGYARVRHT